MKKKLLCALLTACTVLLLTGCELWDHYTLESLALPAATAEDIAGLEEYRKLGLVDFSGSTCYDDIEAYKAAHPEVEVIYTVDVLGNALSPETDKLNLSTMDAALLPELLEDIAYLHQLRSIELMPDEGPSPLSPTDVKTIMDAYPDLELHYSFDLFGQTLDLTTERVEYVQQDIGDEGADAIRAALDIMPNCTYFKVDRCGFSSPVLAQIQEEYPNTKIVWRVFYGLRANGTQLNALTDETVIRSSHYLNNGNVEEMKYLTSVKYMDIGHNEVLTDVSFLQYMPDLELLIISGSTLKDLSPLANAKNLEFLELCFCGMLQDLSPLAGCENLKYLNISGTDVRDLSPLKELPIERFNCILNPRMPSGTKNEFVDAHPECLTVYEGKQPYGYGWRYVDNGYTFWDYYATMREMFHYDELALLNGYDWDEATKNDPW